MNLTAETILAAQAGDADAVTAVLTAMDRLITSRARRADWRMADDLAQAGRVALYESLSRFRVEGDHTVPQFIVFADRTVTGAISDERRALRYQGISPHEAKLWESALRESGGDLSEAERLCTSGALKWRMKPATARAARWAYEAQYAETPEYLPSAEESVPQESRTDANVGAILVSMGVKQADVLASTFGIFGYEEHGFNRDDDLAEYLETTVKKVRGNRTVALKKFASLYVRAYARDDQHGRELLDAMRSLHTRRTA